MGENKTGKLLIEKDKAGGGKAVASKELTREWIQTVMREGRQDVRLDPVGQGFEVEKGFDVLRQLRADGMVSNSENLKKFDHLGIKENHSEATVLISSYNALVNAFAEAMPLPFRSQTMPARRIRSIPVDMVGGVAHDVKVQDIIKLAMFEFVDAKMTGREPNFRELDMTTSVSRVSLSSMSGFGRKRHDADILSGSSMSETMGRNYGLNNVVAASRTSPGDGDKRCLSGPRKTATIPLVSEGKKWMRPFFGRQEKYSRARILMRRRSSHFPGCALPQ